MEKLSVRCAGCDRKVLFEERHIGRRVKCPGCSESILLAAATKSPADVLDPFVELAAPKAPVERAASLPSSNSAPPPKTKRTSSSDTSNAASEGRNPSARKKKSTDDSSSREAVPSSSPSIENKKKAESSDTDDEPFPGGGDESIEAADGYSSDEPFIDEFGLAELGDSQAAWDESKSLPPVSKQFVKKKPRKSSTSDTVPVQASGKPSGPSTPSRDPKAPRPVTTFRSAEDGEKGGRYRLYALFLLTMVPLCYSIVFEKQNSIESRIADADAAEEQPVEGVANPNEDVVNGDPGEAPAAEDGMAEVQSDDGWGDEPAGEDPEFANIEDPEQIFAILPGHRLPGAFLARESSLHWLFAGISGVGFMILFLAMFRRFNSDIGTAIFGAAFTATAGILMLMAFQWAAFATGGFWIRGRSIVTFIFLIIKLIGFSYRCALEEGTSFITSFMGFTLGVGICEEVCKILPVIGYLGSSKKASWQGACLVGLASGVGFGISEGIMYSSSYYNGISTGDIYLVRFISCVALHSVWTGAGAVLLYFNQDGLHGGFDFTDIASTLGMTLGISIIMHGLYDTLLKQEMPFVSLLIGVISIGWLIYIIERQTRDEGVLT